MRILYESDLAGSRKYGMTHRIYQFSEQFIKKGHQVMIVGASYSHVRSSNPKIDGEITKENIGGIEYRWIKTPKYNGNNLGRVIHIFVYNLKLWLYARRFAKEFMPDIVISSGVTPLDFIGCRRIAKKSNGKVILEVGDLWPLSPIELGGYSPKHPFIMMMQWAEDYSYKNTDALVSLLPCAKEYMVKHKLKESKFNYIPNGILESDWSNNEEMLPNEHIKLISLLKIRSQFIVAYTGAHGLANSLRVIIDSVKILKDYNVSLILLGSGQEKEKLINYVKCNNISNVYFLPPINKKQIPVFLKYMDLLYIGLKNQSLFRFGISPNKIFDYMMAGKPIIQAIDAGNDLVKEAKCGESVKPEQVQEITDAILKIKNMPSEERKKLGENGRDYVMRNHTYSVLTIKFLKLMENLITNENSNNNRSTSSIY